MYRIQKDTIIYDLPKEVDHYQADLIKNKTDMLFTDMKIKNVVFDFGKTTLMDSSGIGLVTGRFRRVIERGGKAYAVNINEKIDKLLLMSGIYRIVEKREDIEAVCKELCI